MPHEVIMPALGMAQETGLIVSWMKQPGDAVKTGDPLMEVETDKATMEVEAQADGYLTDLRYDAGQEVPVGEVIALISDTAAGSGAKKPDTQEANEKSAPASAPVEGAKVIMPALGMAQDTGLIVAWMRSPGDPVAADDVLLEVETDKSTMEVPAGHDGYVAALHAEAGQEVPVGDVIAVISTEKPANPVQSRAPAPGAEKKVATPAKAEAPPKRSIETPSPRGSAPTGRMLASPKARRLAAEQGLDLTRLAEAGHPQPYHAADLDLLRDLPPTHAAATAAAKVSAVAQITAKAPRSASDAFLTWAATEGVAVEQGRLWAAFAAAALRRVSDVSGPLIVGLSALGVALRRFADPDLAPLSTDGEQDADGTAALLLRDLSGSAITGIRTGVQDSPVLTIAADGERLLLTLDFTPSQLSEAAAINLVTEFAARLSDPRRHLL